MTTKVSFVETACLPPTNHALREEGCQKEGHTNEGVREEIIPQQAVDGLYGECEEQDVAENTYRLCEADFPSRCFVENHAYMIAKNNVVCSTCHYRGLDQKCVGFSREQG